MSASDTDPKKVLVTGASGMVGAVLCNALIDRGYAVTGLSRNPDAAAKSQPSVEWHQWEPTRERPPAAAIEGAHAAINLAGEPINQRWNASVKERIAQSRIKATANLVDGLTTANAPPKILVSGSAIGYYGNRGDELLYEDAPPGDDFLADVVIEWEAAADAAAGQGIRVVTARTGHVLDPSGGLLGELLTPFRLGVGGPIGDGKQYMSWIHRDDEVGILLWCLENDSVSGPVNATAPNPVTNREFARELGRAVNRPAVVPIPGFALGVLRGPEFGKVLQEGQRVYPKVAVDGGYEFKQPELAGALANLLR